MVGEAGNKTNSALLSWGFAELGKKLMQRMQQGLLKTLFQAVYFPKFMQQKKADLKKNTRVKKAEKS